MSKPLSTYLWWWALLHIQEPHGAVSICYKLSWAPYRCIIEHNNVLFNALHLLTFSGVVNLTAAFFMLVMHLLCLWLNHQSIHYLLLIRVWVAELAASSDNPRLPSPQPLRPTLPEGYQGVPRPDRRHCLSSVSCPICHDRDLLLVGLVRTTSLGRHPGGFLTRCLSHLILSKWRSSGSESLKIFLGKKKNVNSNMYNTVE